MAHFSQDPRLLAVYREGGHGDVYVDMAQGIFGEGWTKDHRSICKTLVLAMGYGAGDKKVGAILTVNGIPTDVETGAAYVRELRETYPTFFEWREQVIAKVHKTGYVQTLSGQRRRLKTAFIDRRNWKNIGYGERQAVNAIIQGSAADIVRRTMMGTESDTALRHIELLAQVHDELVWEAWRHLVTPEDLLLIRWWGEVGHGYELRVPLGFEPLVGASWHEGKEGSPLILPEDIDDDDATLDYESEER
jgi:DNA polymerase-1